MASRDVGEKPNHQGKWLSKNTDYFHWDHDQQHHFGHAGHVKNVPPVIFAARNGGQDQGENGQSESKGNVARGIGPGGQQAQQVVDPDKEEQGKQIGHKAPVVLFPDVGDDHPVANEKDERLQECLQPAWRLAGPLSVGLAHRCEHQHQNDATQKHGSYVLGEGEVQYLLLVGFSDVAMIQAINSIAYYYLIPPVVERAGHKYVQMAIGEQNDRQWEGGVVFFAIGIFVIKKMPGVIIGNVMKDHPLGVKLTFVRWIRLGMD